MAPARRKPEPPPSGKSSGWAVFLRAVNVAGHGTLHTGELPAKLPQFEVHNIGAAGTFVVRGATRPDALRDAFRRAIGFPTEILVRSEGELARLRAAGASTWTIPDPEAKRFVTFLVAEPARRLALPHSVPDPRAWEVRLDALVGVDVLSSSHVRGERRRYYANEVVERLTGVPCTTRGWETLERVWQRFEGP